MKKLLPVVVLACLASSIMLSVTACSSLKSEFLGTPAQQASVTNLPPTGQIVPPIVPQLQAAGSVVGGVVPAPWGTLIESLINLAATGAATYATFHARKAASAAATAATASTSVPKT